MTAKALFNIILKVLGIYFIKDIIVTVPMLLSVFHSYLNTDLYTAVSMTLISLITLLIYSLVIYYLVFKTEWVMNKLKLADELSEEPIPFNIHRSTVISIAVLVVGLYLIVQAIPLLIRELTKWYQYNKAVGRFYASVEPFDYSMIFVFIAEIMIGLLLIGNQRMVVNYIELKQRQKQIE